MNMPANFFNANKQVPNANATQAMGGSALENAAANVAAAANTNVAVVDNGAAPALLAAHKDLWDTSATGNTSKPTGVLPAVTAEQLSTTLANSNFLQSVNPELLAKASSGDAAAFSDVINQGLRAVMAQSVLASHGLVEAGARSQETRLREVLPTMVRSSNVSDSLQSNPLFNNPAIKPVIDNVRMQLETKHPQASAREIAAMTDAYFNDLSKAFRSADDKSQGSAGSSSQPVETDWYAVLGLDNK